MRSIGLRFAAFFCLALTTGSALAEGSAAQISSVKEKIPGTYQMILLVEDVIFEGEESICDTNTTVCDSEHVIQFHQGGTFSQTGENAFLVAGFLSGGDTLLTSTVRLGDWKLVRYNRLRATGIKFGNRFGPISDSPFQYGSTTIIEYNILFNAISRTFTGTFESRTYANDQDPFDPLEVPPQIVSGPIVSGVPAFD